MVDRELYDQPVALIQFPGSKSTDRAARIGSRFLRSDLREFSFNTVKSLVVSAFSAYSRVVALEGKRT